MIDTPQQQFQYFTSDLQAICGNSILAHHSLQSAPIYRVIVSQPPSHPYPASVEPPLFFNLSFHTWDYICAAQAWNQSALWDPLQKYPPFAPAASDVRLGTTLRQLWKSFLHGNVTQLEPGKVYDLKTWENVTSSTYVETLQKCAFLSKVGIGQSFWWVN